jgi:formylglycine-generating enzyme
MSRLALRIPPLSPELGLLLGACFFSAAALLWLGAAERSAPERCPEGTQAGESRCCPAGQVEVKGRCEGEPEGCPGELVLMSALHACVAKPGLASYPGGSVEIGPIDWDAVNVVERRTVAVRPFLLDRHEVTYAQYEACVKARACKAVPAEEPGQPVRGQDALTAEAFCHHAGGRLPTAAEWTFAASGTSARRYPWGPHGLVCRRAAYGLEAGPCGTGAVGPELAGLRPAGRTPEGVHDLVGNVAEWVVTPDGPRPLGGSFRSAKAAELKSWAGTGRTEHHDVGFRCAYGIDSPEWPSP